MKRLLIPIGKAKIATVAAFGDRAVTKVLYGEGRACLLHRRETLNSSLLSAAGIEVQTGDSSPDCDIFALHSGGISRIELRSRFVDCKLGAFTVRRQT